MRVAVLLTCHNRKEKTKACLVNLFEQELPENTSMEVFVCDDGSTDGTGAMLQQNFPAVKIVQGDGNQFWGGGMRMAWNMALEQGGFDFFLWLNDDTFLFPQALQKLFRDYFSLASPKSILLGACKDPRTGRFSFGGSSDSQAVIPQGSPQEVKWINGNLVLIPNAVAAELGNLSGDFTHYLGDYDYGLRAQKKGIKCFTASEYLAACESNSLPYWGSTEVPFAKRWELLHSVKGLAIAEYTRFLKRHFGKGRAYKNLVSSYGRTLFPKLFLRIRDIV
ncbi:glycosyltransferase family 2 protein [Algoriphagus sp. H41]|uniref:Glycosyltransferase family 2 protein n=1 Tax=Algoriphagus oliviformis TaxID=2811231 RepID=A0ABS3CAE4_9BACT|nr:glycosyltransferase family 2 protein [Algoriphagus oliviformis]MBN7813506.1 glycosyltransferase family 2 protein [Algoriphagus oliviformis]